MKKFLPVIAAAGVAAAVTFLGAEAASASEAGRALGRAVVVPLGRA